MLCITIPAHNEEASITQCVAAAIAAGRHDALNGEQVQVLVVADACSDRTAMLARRAGATVLVVNNRNVGAARATGADFALDHGARWLAFTDADTIVSPDWLVKQLQCKADVVCGTVSIDEWHRDAESARLHFLQTYCDVDGHRHIHGANLGVSAQAYKQAGGFQPLCAHEDVALVRALQAAEATICWSAQPRVRTSCRLTSKTGAGFGATLHRWNHALDVPIAIPVGTSIAPLNAREATVREKYFALSVPTSEHISHIAMSLSTIE